MANNNGGHQVSTTYAHDGAAQSFHLLIKLPVSSSVNAAIYYRYDFTSSRSICLILGTRLQGMKTALQQAFPCKPLTGNLQSHGPASPLQVINILVSEYEALMESDRQDLDIRVRELEAKTGMSAHIFDESLRAAANEHNALLKDLHVCDGQLAFYERTQKFQVGLIEWLQAQHETLNHFRFGVRELQGIPPADRPAEEVVTSSFDLLASLSRERLEQVCSLRNRIRIQLNVVVHVIAQVDGRTNIAIAEASRRIAFETKRDSDAMKTIAALTMVFLPATFVATLFGMVFFTAESDSPSGFRVNSLWWIYVAVTIPLTMLTVGAWLGWLRWVRWKRRQDEESLGLKEKSQ
ncbi:MAG: hypothetical protein LQ346_005946 [Caloplaca aetnensis]|nr:MAG: hypothetical protein LQ346_005946 [Caloplaca aetnensis]